MAESIDDVLGAACPISTRCAGAVAAIGGAERLCEPPGGRVIISGSDTLLEFPSNGLFDRLGLLRACQQMYWSLIATTKPTLVSWLSSKNQMSRLSGRSCSPMPEGRPDAPWANAGCRTLARGDGWIGLLGTCCYYWEKVSETSFSSGSRCQEEMLQWCLFAED